VPGTGFAAPLPRARAKRGGEDGLQPDRGDVAEERERRRLLPAFAFTWGFLAFALALAGVILLISYLTGGFGEGQERSGLWLWYA
jgi:hypothetical protein